MSPKLKEQIMQWYADGFSTLAIGIRVGVSGTTIGHWLERWGMPRRHKGEMHHRLSPEARLRIVERYQAGELAKVLAHEYGISQSAVSGLLSRRRIPIHTQARYAHDHTFFARIDTEAKAYWLGFLTADATITDRAVILVLQARD